MNPILYLMLGYPGAGKTTSALEVAKLTGAVHLSSDNFRSHLIAKPTFSLAEHQLVYNALDYITELLLSHGLSVIYDANLNKFEHRRQKVQISQNNNARAVILWVRTDLALARIRATEEGAGKLYRPFGNLSTAVFDRLAAGIETPKNSEFSIEIDGNKITTEQIAVKLKQHKIKINI